VEKDGKQKRRKFSAEYEAETVRLLQRSVMSICMMAGAWYRRNCYEAAV
jgi:hypothetical protein